MPPIELYASFCFCRLTTVDGLSSLVARPCLLGKLPAAGGQGLVMMWLFAKPQVVPGLVLACWYVELGSGVRGCGPNNLGCSLVLLVGGVSS